jgi:hypothetical protein
MGLPAGLAWVQERRDYGGVGEVSNPDTPCVCVWGGAGRAPGEAGDAALITGLAWACLPDLPGFRSGVIMVGLARYATKKP